MFNLLIGNNSVNASLKASITRKKVTAFKVTSKNSNQELT